MPSFQSRLAKADRLESPFIEAFNSSCPNHKIVKFGVESTEMGRIHSFIRSARDTTSQFVRYLPDSTLVQVRGIGNSTDPKTSLIEFKVQDTLIYSDNLFRKIKAAHGQGSPPLRQKQDVFGTERDALDLYNKIAEIGVRVIIVAWQRPRSSLDCLRAQYVEDIVICQQQVPSEMGTGSGTPMSNVHFDSLFPVSDFFESEFGIESEIFDGVVSKVIQGQVP